MFTVNGHDILTVNVAVVEYLVNKGAKIDLLDKVSVLRRRACVTLYVPVRV
jgi:hypothetical protein